MEPLQNVIEPGDLLSLQMDLAAERRVLQVGHDRLRPMEHVVRLVDERVYRERRHGCFRTDPEGAGGIIALLTHGNASFNTGREATKQKHGDSVFGRGK
ncbi:hypothetical protein [Endothiovibrio diazotrophicus]